MGTAQHIADWKQQNTSLDSSTLYYQLLADTKKEQDELTVYEFKFTGKHNLSETFQDNVKKGIENTFIPTSWNRQTHTKNNYF